MIHLRVATLRFPIAAIVCVGLTFLFISGCGQGRPKLVKVSGQVLIDGQPLITGVPGFIQVIPQGTRAATGKIDPASGRFTLSTFEEGDGCVPGTHKVAIILRAMVGNESVSLIDEKYANPETSGLTVTIDKPTDSLTIEIQGPLKRVQVAPVSDDPNKF